MNEKLQQIFIELTLKAEQVTLFFNQQMTYNYSGINFVVVTKFN